MLLTSICGGAYEGLQGREKEPRQEGGKETVEGALDMVLKGKLGKCTSGRKVTYLKTGTEV